MLPSLPCRLLRVGSRVAASPRPVLTGLRSALAAAQAIDRIAELINDDNSVGGEVQMDSLIKMMSDEGGSLGSTAEDLIIEVLLATPPKPLLERLSHSDALARVDEWLARSAADSYETRTLQLLCLLARMPMSIEALQKSGVGKTVNKLRKAPELPIKDAAEQLVKDWKRVAAPTTSAAPAADTSAASGSSAAVKRPLVADAASAAKKLATSAGAKPASSSSSSLHDEADNSFEAAFGAAAARTAPRSA